MLEIEDAEVYVLEDSKLLCCGKSSAKHQNQRELFTVRTEDNFRKAVVVVEGMVLVLVLVGIGERIDMGDEDSLKFQRKCSVI